VAKRDACKTKLGPLLPDRAKLESYLLKNSGLPGRRANIELAAALADVFQEKGATEAQWKLLVEWASLSSDEAPTNSRREFLPFCAVQALGALYLDSDDARREEIFAMLRDASRSSRWRTREAAAFAFQRIGEGDFEVLKGLLSTWLDRASLSEWRAIVAALAHPPFFETKGEGEGGSEAVAPVGAARAEPDVPVAFALEVAGTIMAAVHKLPKSGRATEEFRVLSKGLGYALSVFAAASPADGFRFLRRWAGADDNDIKKIVAANIRKARLAKRFGDECREVGEILSWD